MTHYAVTAPIPNRIPDTRQCVCMLPCGCAADRAPGGHARTYWGRRHKTINIRANAVAARCIHGGSSVLTPYTMIDDYVAGGV
ncbi:MAG: hypothetical protein MPJ06_06050 [Nitrosopumilus sp.]|nr:hypothetical protein [Nitrosopumilus sp.]